MKSYNIATIRDVFTMESKPLTQRNLAANTYEVFQRSAQQHAEKIALRFMLSGKPDEPSIEYSYGDLLQRITQTANLFYQLGIRENNVVSLLLPNLPQNHFALWGAQAVGIANPINPMLTTEHIIKIMNAAKTNVLVTQAPQLWEKVSKIAACVPTLETILIVKMATSSHNELYQINDKIKVLDFDSAIAQCHGDKLEGQREARPQSIACYFHTGGTTGAPKLAVQSHLNQVFSAWMVGQQLQWEAKDVMHCGLPLFHVNAPLISGLAPFTVGGEVVMTAPQGFRSETVVANFWKLIERYRISFFMAVPTVYLALNKNWSADIDTSSLKFAACGAAPMPVALINEFHERTHIPILEGYGLTEGTVFSCVNPPFGERKPGSIGIRIPYQQMKTVIVDDDGKMVRDCKPHEIGTIVINGPNVFQGYLQESDNQNIWADPGWLNTGDLGCHDEEGYFWLTGRSKDLIIRGGHNIDPKIIEEALTLHPAVAIAAAVGAPDKKMGEVPVAYVTLKENATLTEKELATFAAKKISEHVAMPQAIYIIPAMPVTAIGKIYKPELRLDAIKRVFAEALSAIDIPLQIEVVSDAQKGQIAKILVEKNKYSEVLVEKIRSLLKFFKVEIEICV